MRFKKVFEVYKYYIYYCLLREGEFFVRRIDEKWLKEYFNVFFFDGWRVVKEFLRSGKFDGLLKEF